MRGVWALGWRGWRASWVDKSREREREGEIIASPFFSFSLFFLLSCSSSVSSLSTSNSRVDEELLGNAAADDAAVVAGCVVRERGREESR